MGALSDLFSDRLFFGRDYLMSQQELIEHYQEQLTLVEKGSLILSSARLAILKETIAALGNPPDDVAELVQKVVDIQRDNFQSCTYESDVMSETIAALSSLSRENEQRRKIAAHLHDVNTKLQSEIERLNGKTHDPYCFIRQDDEKFWSERLVNNLQSEIESLRAQILKMNDRISQLETGAW